MIGRDGAARTYPVGGFAAGCRWSLSS